MPRRKTNCYEIPVELGSHFLYLIIAPDEKSADNYIRKKFNVPIEHTSSEESGAYFAGNYNQLFVYFPKNRSLDYLVHELVHVKTYMVNRMGTVLDEEGEAYLMQMLYLKVVTKLIEIGYVKITYGK